MVYFHEEDDGKFVFLCIALQDNRFLCGHKSGYLHLHSLLIERREACDDEGMSTCVCFLVRNG